MRDLGAAFWLRFHALPNSKRYADTDEEKQIVISRANTVARAVLGEGAPCWLVQAGGGSDWAQGGRDWLSDLSIPHVADWRYDEQTWPIHAIRTPFASGEFDVLLGEIADERALRTLWMNTDNGRVFAPYDGGFDLFLRSSDEVEFLKTRHPSWLSDREDGL